MPECKEVLQTHTHKHTHTNRLRGYVKGTQEPNERTPNGQNWNNLSSKINSWIITYRKNKYP